MWGGGVISYTLLGGPPSDAGWTASAFLLLAGLLVAVSSRPEDLKRLVAGAMIGFAAELAGVHWGIVFSPYRYTDVLQPQVARVPVVMIAAWLVLLAYVWQMVGMLKLRGWGEVVCGALWMTAIDLVIDPLAAGELGYWVWEGAGPYYGIPWHNFAGWFAVSAMIFIVTRREYEPNLWVRATGLSIILFFTVIAFALGLLLGGAIGVLLCGLHFGRGRAYPRPSWRNPGS